VLREAITAVDRPALCRLEGDLSLLPTVRARYRVHLTWSVESATASIFELTHFLSISYIYRGPALGPRIEEQEVSAYIVVPQRRQKWGYFHFLTTSSTLTIFAP
jgi:hypothetical protein